MLERLLPWWRRQALRPRAARVRRDRLHDHHDAVGGRRDRAPDARTRSPRPALDGHAVAVTLVLLALLGAVFLRGFREAIGIAVVLVGRLPGRSTPSWSASALAHVVEHPAVLPDWSAALTTQHGEPWLMVVGVALLVFPKLALGLSGFETGVAVMPQIRGAAATPRSGRSAASRGAHALLTTAALIMSVVPDRQSSFVTTLLIPPADFQAGRRGQRARAGLPGARVPRRRLRHASTTSAPSRSSGSPAPRRWRACSTSCRATCRATGWRRGGRGPSGRSCSSSPASPSWSRCSSTPTWTRRAAPTRPASWC